MLAFWRKLRYSTSKLRFTFAKKQINFYLMKTVNRISLFFLVLMGLAFANVGIQALVNPQSVMDNVSIVLNNTSAFSSIRAIYGGMHLVFGLFCFWGAFKMQKEALGLVILYTLGFVAGRLVGVGIDGAPNSFVITWLITESASCLIAIGLLKGHLINKNLTVSPSRN
jgi:hypothetical protein